MKSSKVVAYEFMGRFHVDTQSRQVLRDGKPLEQPLTSMELEVLEFFLKQPRQVIPRDAVTPLYEVSRIGRAPTDDYISKIRRKLGLKPGELFQIVRNTGYRFEADVRPILQADQEEAGELYQTSLFHFNLHTVESMKISLAQALKALEANPYGLAETNIVIAYDLINLAYVASAAMLPAEALPKARAAAERVLAEEPKSAPARGVLGLLALIYDYDWARAEALIQEALTLNPDETATMLTYAHLLVASGRTDEGLAYIDRVARMDPTDRIVYVSWGWLYLLAGRLEQAEQLSEKAKFHFPDFSAAHFLLGLAYEFRGKHDAARERYQRCIELEPVPVAVAALGHLNGKTGKAALARSALRDLAALQEHGTIAYVPAYCTALIYAGLGKEEECLTALEAAFDERCDWLIHMAVEPRWNPVRNTLRFKALVRRVGIPDKPGESVIGVNETRAPQSP